MNFYAFPVGFTGGVRVAAGDVNGDGRADVIVGAGPGGGPHVRVFSGATGAELLSFFTYDANYSGGVYVASGQVVGGGGAEILVGTGGDYDPIARVFSPSGALLAESLAYPSGFTGGVRVAVAVNANGAAQLITGAGPGGGPQVRGFTIPASCP
jgi:hypothetical protein